MKRTRKVLAGILALAIMFSMCVNVFAVDPLEETITSSGKVYYGDPIEIFDCALPTGLAWDFIVDPFGVAAVEIGAVVDLDTPGDGEVIFSEEIPIITSYSSEIVTLDVVAKGTGDATFTATAAAADFDGTKDSIHAQLIASETDARAYTAGTGFIGSTSFSGAVGRAITTTGTAYQFIFPAVDYDAIVTAKDEVSGKVTFQEFFDLDAPGPNFGYGTKLKPVGKIDVSDEEALAAWAGYITATTPKTVGLEVKFTATVAPAATGTEHARAKFLTAAAGVDIVAATDITQSAPATSFAVLGYALTSRTPTAVSLPFTFGTQPGATASDPPVARTLASAECIGLDLPIGTETGDFISSTTSAIVINQAFLQAFVDLNVRGNVPINFTLSDGSVYTLQFISNFPD